jgi:hypothetical protein
MRGIGRRVVAPPSCDSSAQIESVLCSRQSRTSTLFLINSKSARSRSASSPPAASTLSRARDPLPTLSTRPRAPDLLRWRPLSFLWTSKAARSRRLLFPRHRTVTTLYPPSRCLTTTRPSRSSLPCTSPFSLRARGIDRLAPVRGSVLP